MCNCQERFCCFSCVSISKNNTPDHNGILNEAVASGKNLKFACRMRTNSLEIFVVQQTGFSGSRKPFSGSFCEALTFIGWLVVLHNLRSIIITDLLPSCHYFTYHVL